MWSWLLLLSATLGADIFLSASTREHSILNAKRRKAIIASAATLAAALLLSPTVSSASNNFDRGFFVKAGSDIGGERFTVTKGHATGDIEGTEPEGETESKTGVLALTIRTNAAGIMCGTGAGVSLGGVSSDATVTDPSGNKQPITDGLVRMPTVGKWKIEGKFDRIGDPAVMGYDRNECIASVDEWSNTGTTNADYAFVNAHNMSSFPTPPKTITSMEQMLGQAFILETDVSKWDVSKVTNMEGLFANNRNLTSDMSSWDTSKVTNMKYMFNGARKITDNGIGNFDVSKVEDMESMFTEANSFDGDLSKWRTPALKKAHSMFYNAKSFTGKGIENMDISGVTHPYYMFSGAEAFNGDISKWDVSNAENMDNMLFNAKSFDRDLSGWNVSKVTSRAGFSNGSLLTAEKLPKWK
jgi:surface protein